MRKILLALLAGLASCGAGTDPADVASGQATVVTRAEMGAAWPFSVERVTVHCTAGGNYRLVTDPAGNTYGLNGTSKMARNNDGARKWKDIDKIWLPGKDLGPILEIAARNCK